MLPSADFTFFYTLECTMCFIRYDVYSVILQHQGLGMQSVCLTPVEICLRFRTTNNFAPRRPFRDDRREAS